jgi:hypothetical protein
MKALIKSLAKRLAVVGLPGPDAVRFFSALLSRVGFPARFDQTRCVRII